jgi:nitrile hydratase subunit beta
MNGVHDMGGMQNFGPVRPETNEPAFHDPWEKRVFAATLAMGATGLWNIDQSRAARESLPAARYLASSYYQIWLEGLCKLMLERGLVTPEELRDGQMLEPPPGILSVLTAARVAPVLARGSPTERPLSGSARFGVGDTVRSRLLNPTSHTRLPRYCRGKPGTIAMIHGTHVFPDAVAAGRGEQPQWLYSVRFEARDLWGTDTTAAAVHVDCWESYLEAR